MIAHRRLPAVAICALAAFAVIGAAGPARAVEPAGTELLPNWRILDATVTRPGTPPRHLNSKQATAYLQSWYLATIYGTLRPGKPPASLPVNTVTARESIKGKPYTFVSFYVTDGKQQAWIGVPPQAAIGPGASIPTEKWFIAPARTTPAFLGKVDPIPVRDLSGGTTTTTATTATPPAQPNDDSSSDTAGWLVAGGVILVGLVLIVALGRSRRAADAETEPAPAAHGPDTP